MKSMGDQDTFPAGAENRSKKFNSVMTIRVIGLSYITTQFPYRKYQFESLGRKGSHGSGDTAIRFTYLRMSQYLDDMIYSTEYALWV